MTTNITELNSSNTKFKIDHIIFNDYILKNQLELLSKLQSSKSYKFNLIDIYDFFQQILIFHRLRFQQ